MSPKNTYYKNVATTIINNLKKRQMDGFYFETAKEAVEKANSYLNEGCTVSYGGSMTLSESGMLASLQNNASITLFDRSKATSPEETTEIYHKALSADYYFMSTNAITTDGELINVDGNGNRVAALIYGPKTVFVLVGMNKVCRNEQDALLRVHNTASPMNCNRLEKQTPCAATGICADCLSPDCICNQTVITRRSGIPGRIKVLLIGEELGY